jgi:allantoinase
MTAFPELPPRDFLGYGDKPPAIRWPNDARVAVSLVVNVEEGAEMTVTAGDGKNESVYEIVAEVVGDPDLCMESHFEYGSRAGWWRIMGLLEQHNAKATMNICSRAVHLSPWMAQAAVKAGHEMSCHGWRWEGHGGMAEEVERATIARAVKQIRDACGERPVGLHLKSTWTPRTRRLIVEEGGFLYDSNAYNDDMPYIVQVSGKPHVVLPYSFDTNDMRYTRNGGFEFAGDFARYCIDALDWLWEEGRTMPRMMTIGLHLRIIGRPGRIAGLAAFLEHCRKKGGIWFARRDEIAHHWRKAVGLPEWRPAERS